MNYATPGPAPSLPQPVVPYATYTDARDAEHLRLLSIFHYVYGGLAALVSCFFILYIVIGLFMVNGAIGHRDGNAAGGNRRWRRDDGDGGNATRSATPAFGWLFVGVGTVGLLIGWMMAGLTIASGRCLSRHRGRTFSLIVAGVNCLSVPFGTALGVFTFIVLLRESVATLYVGDKR